MKIDEKGFREIFEAYFEPICRFLNLYTKNESVIEDIIQEIFCNLWINRDVLQIKHLKSYLYTSARNRMLNYVRDEKLHAAILASYLLEEKELHDAYECVDQEEFNKKLEGAIEELPAKCKNVFKMSRYNNMTYKQIAAKEGISEKMVEKHIAVAMKKIKEKIINKPFIIL